MLLRPTILAIIAAALVSGIAAFAPITNFGSALPTRAPAHAISLRPDVRIHQGIQKVSARQLRTAVAAAPESSSMVPRDMEQGIYNFNKVVIDTVYDIICLLYPVTGGPRDFARFYVLETVARVPYFAYLSVMHLRETFGARDSGLGERMRTHYAEADNELHHLLIMESLGGNSSFIDRTVAQTMAFGYYWYVTGVYSFSEQAAYHLSELIEDHAYNTYNKFLAEHEAKLKSMPVPPIARKYYEEENPFLFDLFCTVKDVDDSGQFSQRRPKLESLYDVFVNVRDDEREHWKTLCNLVQYNDMQGVGNKEVTGTKAKPALAASSTS
jgi:ubiquinol oxidase